MKGKGTAYQNLYTELVGYEKNGVYLLIDGSYASSMQVVKQIMAKEAGTYMRDYEMDSEGYIESLSFTNINTKKEKENQSQIPLYSD